MLASKLIVLLKQAIEMDGDIHVGIENQEYACFEAISCVSVKCAVRTRQLSDDDASLGEKFVSIS